MNTHQARADAQHRAARIRRRIKRAALFAGLILAGYVVGKIAMSLLAKTTSFETIVLGAFR
jgi:hypothetical protein